MSSATEVLLDRINLALDEAGSIFARFDSGRIAELKKAGGDPVTEVDVEIDRVLREALLCDGEGWLSEESADDRTRLSRDLVWIVDPIDGTREFIDGLPEFCTSIAAVVNGVPVVGGVLNPATCLRMVGAEGVGLTCNGHPVGESTSGGRLHDLTVLASRSEVARGQWTVVETAGISIEPMGSVAYKLARVAAGLDDATWTPVPKHEWDVAGGAALLRAVGGTALGADGETLTFNQPKPWFSGVNSGPTRLRAQRSRRYRDDPSAERITDSFAPSLTWVDDTWRYL